MEHNARVRMASIASEGRRARFLLNHIEVLLPFITPQAAAHIRCEAAIRAVMHASLVLYAQLLSTGINPDRPHFTAVQDVCLLNYWVWSRSGVWDWGVGSWHVFMWGNETTGSDETTTCLSASSHSYC